MYHLEIQLIINILYSYANYLWQDLRLIPDTGCQNKYDIWVRGIDCILGTNLNILWSNFYLYLLNILLQVKSVTIMVMNPIICRPVSSAEISRHLMDKNRPSTVDKDMTTMTYDKPRKEPFYFIFCLILNIPCVVRFSIIWIHFFNAVEFIKNC